MAPGQGGHRGCPEAVRVREEVWAGGCLPAFSGEGAALQDHISPLRSGPFPLPSSRRNVFLSLLG